MRGGYAALLVAAVFTGACGGTSDDGKREDDRDGSPATGRAAPPDGRLQLREAARVEAAYVLGDRAYGVPGGRGEQQLEGTANAPFSGALSPTAVPAPGDEPSLAYNSFRRARPVIRVYEAELRRDSVVAEGAFSLAWRRDGALGYFSGLRPRVTDPRRYRGHLVVQPRGERPTRWTMRPARYVAAAWAGSQLIAYRLVRERPDVLALEGRGRVRVLAQNAYLIAVSPDGRRIAIGRQRPRGAHVRVIDVADGRDVAQLVLRAKAVAFVAAGGSWVGDRIFGSTDRGLVVLRLQDEKLEVEQLLDVDLTTLPVGIQEPRADPSGRRIVGWAELAPAPGQAVPQQALVECDRFTLRCRRGPPGPSLPGPRPLYNPSRP